jgi:hypothetical protein
MNLKVLLDLIYSKKKLLPLAFSSFIIMKRNTMTIYASVHTCHLTLLQDKSSR